MTTLSLKDFIAKSMNEIMDGVVEAQKHATEVKGAINPYIYTNTIGIKTVASDNDITRAPIPTLEFDIGVSIGEDDKAQGGLGVFAAARAVGAKGQSAEHSETVSRIKFQANVVLPIQVIVHK